MSLHYFHRLVTLANCFSQVKACVQVHWVLEDFALEMWHILFPLCAVAFGNSTDHVNMDVAIDDWHCCSPGSFVCTVAAVELLVYYAVVMTEAVFLDQLVTVYE